MRIRALVVTGAAPALLLIAILLGGACTHPSAQLKVDIPQLVDYRPPDIDEITGIDSSEEDEEEAAAPEAGSAQNPQQPPRKK